MYAIQVVQTPSPPSHPLIVEFQTRWKELIGKAAGFTALLLQKILSVCSSIGDGERAVKAHGPSALLALSPSLALQHHSTAFLCGSYPLVPGIFGQRLCVYNKEYI